MQYKDHIVEALGLDFLGLDERVIERIVKDLMDAVVTSTSYKPSLDVILKRIERHKKQLYKIIVYNMLENIPVKKMSMQQLEFVINYGEEVLIPYIDELYKVAVANNRDDLVSMLQYIWEKYGRPSPIACPKCGFRSVMPDLSCLVCGYVVKEDYVREKLDFDTKFMEYIKSASVAELREVLDIGFVLLSETCIKSPKERIDPSREFFYQIYLKPRDVSLILEEISNRKIPV
ncbi:hypothetical protein J4526_04610 [Desulfurococcaceae archaeon MEX13E-LK6-19]|nr:hypothetical protein J4526_04610 [Desulfurococcaceae archaeon MEX13E-LK6-19]